MSTIDRSATSPESGSGNLLMGGQTLAREHVDVVFSVLEAELDCAIDGLVRFSPHIRFVHAAAVAALGAATDPVVVTANGRTSVGNDAGFNIVVDDGRMAW